MPNERKLALNEATLSRKSKRKLYDFSYPTAKLDELSGNKELLLKILNNPNKEFGGLVGLSSDDEEEQEEAEAEMSLQRYSRHNLEAHQEHQEPTIFTHMAGIAILMRLLHKQPRRVFKIWKRETDLCLLEIRHKIDLKSIAFKKAQVVALISIRIANRSCLFRFQNHYF